jgi:hypothetical protein
MIILFKASPRIVSTLLFLVFMAGTAAPQAGSPEPPPPLELIRPGTDGRHFVKAASGEHFIVWGVNYDHDDAHVLLEDYWAEKWPTVVEDFGEIKALGANVVRIHLQTARFMQAPDRVDAAALERLGRVVELAEKTGLYLDVTGLGCYHKQDVPAWYDALDEAGRWEVQALFWEGVARTCAGSDAIFCYDLMNEPVLPGAGETKTDWLAGAFAGKHFVQYISLDLEGRTREQVARAWVEKLAAAIRKHDDRHMITVGVIPWALTFPGAKPIFYSEEAGAALDFTSVHFYPKKGEVDKALAALNLYEVGKPLVIEEMFPLSCGMEELCAFIDGSRAIADGWISFYWGKRIDEFTAADGIGGAIVKEWLERFRSLAPEMTAADGEEPRFDKRVILERGERPGAFAIPKMVVTPGGAAVIVAQDREGGDWGKRIDPVCLRSDDGGRTWSGPHLMIPEDFPGRETSHMKPTGIVVDRGTGRIFAFVSRSPLVNRDGKPIHERWFYTNIRETRRLGRAWFLVFSDDGGRTWSDPVEITGQLIKKPHWQEWSPVHTGIQIGGGAHAGRLVVPVRCYCPDEDPSTHDLRFQSNGVIFSDDGGATWTPGGRSEPYLGECSIAERSDGTIYVNHRTSNHPERRAERMQNASLDGGATFTACEPSGLEDARCHAGLVAFAAPGAQDGEGGRRFFLLSSVPGPKRLGLTISYSLDEGRTWTRGRVVHEGHTAYSDLAVLHDGTILCVYETGAKTSRRDLAVARFNLAWVLGSDG